MAGAQAQTEAQTEAQNETQTEAQVQAQAQVGVQVRVQVQKAARARALNCAQLVDIVVSYLKGVRQFSRHASQFRIPGRHMSVMHKL